MSRDGVGLWLLVAMGAGALALGFAMIDVMTEFRQTPATSWRPRIETGIYAVLLGALILAAFGLRRELARAEMRSLALEESEKKFRALADTAPAMIWQSDGQGRWTFANGSWLRFRGRALEQELGWGWAQGLHPDDAEGYTAGFKEAVAARAGFSMQVRMKGASGDYRAILNHATPRFDESGQFIGCLGCCVDIEDIRRAEAERETTERRLKVMMNNTPALAYIKDLDGKYQFVNRRYEELLHLPSEKILGKTDFELFPEASARVFRETDRRVAAMGQPEKYEHIVSFPDGERAYLTTKFPLRGLDGTIYGLGGLTTDITDRRAAEELLRQNMVQITASLERERTLMRELDHRVRNNIAGLLGLVSIYERTGRPGGEIAAAVRGKLLAMRDVHEIISRGNGGPISLTQLVRKIATGVLVPARVSELEWGGPEVSIPPAQAHAMAMILHELVTNSTKHGGLGAAMGGARLCWSIAPGDLLRLDWIEKRSGSGEGCASGCPARGVSGGVGLSLIEGLCRSELRGSFERVDGPDGFHAVLTARLNDSAEPPCEPEDLGISLEIPT